MPIKIVKGVPLPTTIAGGPGRKSIYPWDELEVGDSFFVPKRIASSITYASKMHGIKLVYRTVTVDGVTGTRVWRVS